MNKRHTIDFTPQGVCSQRIEIVLDGKMISEVHFTGGCNGNTQGLAALLRGMEAEDAIKRLEGINCKNKGTSCPDQLAKALKSIR